ncbi:hypothetical protein F5877DRAFT_71236 [Lentinula edodes]|nr:hypothetical protein F5877DRAFT_71236 [Lentinula edodes]
MRLLISFFLFFGLTSIVWAAPRPVSNTPICFELVPVSTTHSSWVKMETLEAQISRRGILARTEETKGTYENPLRLGITFLGKDYHWLPQYTVNITGEYQTEVEKIIRKVFKSRTVEKILGVVEIESFKGTVVASCHAQVFFSISGDANPHPCYEGNVVTNTGFFTIYRRKGDPITNGHLIEDKIDPAAQM